MIPRTQPLIIPDSKRYWFVELDGGQHHWRFPYYGVASQLLKLSAKYQKRDKEAPATIERTISQFPLYGAVIGSCWSHRVFSLESEAPDVAEPDLAVYEAYGRAVIDEIQDKYDLFEILDLFSSATTGVSKRYFPVSDAPEVSDFTPPQEAPPTS